MTSILFHWCAFQAYDADVEGADEAHGEDGGPGGHARRGGHGQGRGVQTEASVEELVNNVTNGAQLLQGDRVVPHLDILSERDGIWFTGAR